MTTLRQFPDTLILALLHGRTQARAAAIGKACRMTQAKVRSRLVHLESLRLVASRHDKRTGPPSRAYMITAEGRNGFVPASPRTDGTLIVPSRSYMQ